jgi:seryl-tRNA synthetase
MLLVPYIRENTQLVIDRLAVRNFEAASLVDEVLKLDDDRKHIQAEMDEVLAKSNRLSKEIGELFRSGKKDEANALKEETKELKESSHEMKDKLSQVENQLREVLLQIPNVPHQSVPKGRDEEDNEIIREEGNTPKLHEGNKPHWELAEQYDLIDFDLGSKITGAGFPVYKGKGARLQRALINYFLDEGRDAGYNEVIPPLLVNEDSGMGTGQLPDKEGQMYHTAADNLYLIPTAEVPITNIYRDVILKQEEFPVKVCGYTPCFRREAGSYGKDVRGLNRLHQFDKVEIVQIVHPEESYKTLDTMVAHVTGLLGKLGLQYRVARLCGGDLGFTATLTFDMEVYSAAQKRWLEVSSVSNFETFQANRLKCRFKDENGKSQLVHTLNGSALALPRIVASLLENNQTPEGIRIPEVLVPYTGFDVID